MNILLLAAREAQNASYSQYSGFKVGAAVIGGSGAVYTGCNIENASYGLTVCAERVAIFSAIAAGETSIKEVAVTCQGNGANPPENSLMPCGACRQVMVEFCTADTKIRIDGIGSPYLGDLMPKPFKLGEF